MCMYTLLDRPFGKNRRSAMDVEVSVVAGNELGSIEQSLVTRLHHGGNIPGTTMYMHTSRDLNSSSACLYITHQQASNLNSIFEQLQGPNIRRVLRALDQSKSTYCTTFARLCKEVGHIHNPSWNIYASWCRLAKLNRDATLAGYRTRL